MPLGLTQKIGIFLIAITRSMLSLYPSMLPVIGGDCKFCEMFLQFEVTCTYNGRHKYIRVFRRLEEVGEKRYA